MREIERFKEQILREYPRLNSQSSFSFQCHRDLPCFNECCADVNIFLTPYDVIRLKKNLGISSTELLKRYTLSPFDRNLPYPVILLQMGEDDKKQCPFVTEQGCRVYPDRPWACRMYPLGLASPGRDAETLDEAFYFLLKESACKGFTVDRTITVAEWLEDQGITEYDRWGEYYKELTTHSFFREGGKLAPEKIEMFFLACYDIDRFRQFVFESSFLQKFEVDEDTQKRIRQDDVEMLTFGYQWLRFALFGEKSMTIRSDVASAKRAELRQKAAKRRP